MYEFYFGTKEEILNNEKKYLLFVKKLLPRWANGIPDSEFLAMYDILNDMHFEGKKPVFVETGSGASSLMLLYFAMKYNGKLYSWDINGSKASFLKNVANSTMGKSFEESIYKYWNFIEFSSSDPNLGIPILNELNEKVSFCFLDSWHTWENVNAEMNCLKDNFSDEFVVAIDDANYKNNNYNYQFVNMFRKKLGLKEVKEPKDNVGETYYNRVEDFLKNNFSSVTKINDSYKENYTTDVFFDYFSVDKEVMGRVGMEKSDNLDHRFDAWKVTQ